MYLVRQDKYALVFWFYLIYNYLSLGSPYRVIDYELWWGLDKVKTKTYGGF